MRTFLIMLCLSIITLAHVACATEDDYPIVIPDTSDGPDEVVIPLEDVPETVFKDAESTARQRCKNLNEFHFTFRPECTQTYQNWGWRVPADAFCDSYVDGMDPSCYDEFSMWMFHSYNYGFTYYPPPGHWYGDGLKWVCAPNGWPYLTSPNNSSSYRDAFYACDPNYLQKPSPLEFGQVSEL